ncbi:hypothetical protein [Chitinophaga sp. sic0106]|uniref:hypothetical protein n=1 Tax=Chitinophaga sp. sic0106 TaxID=2854785 RepID=UPI001C48A972|nr:hypothetical protein [Chitinophaga sp. sic0106]MBV7531820.1 hypothetical protein [Chitinophaga sp. sic0106]
MSVTYSIVFSADYDHQLYKGNQLIYIVHAKFPDSQILIKDIYGKVLSAISTRLIRQIGELDQLEISLGLVSNIGTYRIAYSSVLFNSNYEWDFNEMHWEIKVRFCYIALFLDDKRVGNYRDGTIGRFAYAGELVLTESTELLLLSVLVHMYYVQTIDPG